MQDNDDFETPKSKSQLKREMNALQELGEELVNLSTKDLTKIPLPEDLVDAIYLARDIKSHGGHKRQLQYIGKLIRNIDAEPIQQALNAIHLRGQQSTTRFHKIEQWRDRLINEGNEALNELIALHPQAERQQLRQLMLNINKESKQNKPPKSARNLFRYLRELMAEDTN